VVTNDDEKADQKLVTGDAVNVAARLEQAAPVNEIYLDETTWQLVRDAAESEAVEPLQLKGKAERVDRLPPGVGVRPGRLRAAPGHARSPPVPACCAAAACPMATASPSGPGGHGRRSGRHP